MTYQWGELRYSVGRSFIFSISLLLIVLPLHKHLCPKIKLQIHIIISHFPQDVSYSPPSFHGLHPENLRNFCHAIKTSPPHLGTCNSLSQAPSSESNKERVGLPPASLFLVPILHKGHRTVFSMGQCPENCWHPTRTAINSNKNTSYIYNRRKHDQIPVPV